MQLFIGLVGVFLSFEVFASVARVTPSLSIAAEYYYSKYDFNQALALWREVYKSQPHSVEAVLKVSELELLLEGHEAAQKTILDFLNKHQHVISPSNYRRLYQQLNEMQNRFVRDDSQSFYFQSLAKIKLQDFSQALVVLNQANNFEKGNLRILEAKAKCEKQLGLFSKFYETLKSTKEVAQVSKSWTENLLESQYYFKDYSEVLHWFELQVKAHISPRQKIASAMALIEKGQNKEGGSLLLQINEAFKHSPPHPIVWYGLGRTMMSSQNSGVAIQYFERFLSSAGRPESFLIDGWDPYRSQEKVAEVTQWLSELRQSP